MGATRRTVKRILLVPLLFLAGSLRATQIVVFGEKDFYLLDAAGVPGRPAEPDRAAFFDGYRADVEGKAPLEKSMALVSPPAWGKTVGPTTHGELEFHPSFPGGFACRITLDGLLPDHEYILTLNGNPEKPGNGLLPSGVPDSEKEKYYDFLIIRTDANGHYAANLGIFLKPGDYEVRFYVKDTGDFKIVLYRDFFPFAVK